MVPKRDGAHPVLDAFPFESNPESPWSRERIAGFQKRLDKIAGLSSNGRSNVRLIWPADPNPAISMHPVGGELRARYRLWTNEYECQRTDPATGLEVVEIVKVDIVPPRFEIEEFHEAAEMAINPDEGKSGDGYYSHLFTVAHHDDKCCGGTEAAGGGLCLGLYREPGDRDIEELQRRIRLRDTARAGHRPGEAITDAEMREDLRDLRDWQARYDDKLKTDYREAAMGALAVNGWRLFNHDAGKKSRYHILGGK